MGLARSMRSGIEARDLQRRYYASTASEYDTLHAGENEHNVALDHVSCLIDLLELCSVLDVGCGTGRAVKHLLARHPDLEVKGIEPVTALIAEAERTGVPAGVIVSGTGEALPFEDGSFDAVCEFGVLHHVENPRSVVDEMMRVARRAVFLSDTNRFGHGPRVMRWTKLILCKLRVWPLVHWLKTGGRGYRLSPGDGVSFSYSVFDSYAPLARWADRVVLVPTRPVTSTSWLHPLLTTDHVLLCAIRDA
jgi:ubiquinone/menaquinone biosynthesis C-methylase UbiE